MKKTSNGKSNILGNTQARDFYFNNCIPGIFIVPSIFHSMDLIAQSRFIPQFNLTTKLSLFLSKPIAPYAKSILHCWKSIWKVTMRACSALTALLELKHLLKLAITVKLSFPIIIMNMEFIIMTTINCFRIDCSHFVWPFSPKKFQ